MKERKIRNFNTFNFLNESWFNQWQRMGIEPSTQDLGPNTGFASDPQLSIFSNTGTKYVDNFARLSAMIADLTKVQQNLFNQGTFKDIYNQIDGFSNDVDLYSDFKILRTYINDSNKIDVYISFYFDDVEYFGVFKNFNDNLNKTKLKSDLLTDLTRPQINHEYYLKLNTYIYNIIKDWYEPTPGKWKNLNKNSILKNTLGQIINIKEGAVVELLYTDRDKDGDMYIVVKYGEQKYYITKNNYYFFKYWFEKV